MEYKICSWCCKEKSIFNFSKKYKTKDGIQKHSSICKKCFNEKDQKRRELKEHKEKKKKYDKVYYSLNQEKILKKKKEYHINNQEKILEYKKIYRIDNKDKIIKYFKNNKYRVRHAQKTYRKKYPHIIAWRRILHRTLCYLGTEKEGDTQHMLGYSALKLKHHIEKQFKEGMDWVNYGEWEIDHIKPLTSFGENSSPKDVNNLNNLQPLWKKENMIKFNTLIS